MAITLSGVLVDGLMKPLVNTTVALVAKGNTLVTIIGSEAVFRTNSQGAYSVSVNPGHYNVLIGPVGQEPYRAGDIVLYADSADGSLNGYLVNWIPEDLTPDVIKQVRELVDAAADSVGAAASSAAAAEADRVTVERLTGETAAYAEAANISRNEAEGFSQTAKQAQSSATGSANSARQDAATTAQLKADVVQLKADTQGIKDSAVGEVVQAKDSAVGEVVQAKDSAVGEVNSTKDIAIGSVTTAKDQAVAAITPLVQSAQRSESEAGRLAGEALVYRNEANNAAQTATTQAGIATQKADLAGQHAQSAQQVLASSLKKDQNLGDLQDVVKARNHIGLGILNNPRFQGLDLTNNDNILNSGVINLNRIKAADGTVTSQARIYHEVNSGIARITLHVKINNKSQYYYMDENGKLEGLTDVRSENFNGTRLEARRGGWVGVFDIDKNGGGNRDIYLISPAADDPPQMSWVGYLQGNWYNDYWQLGGIRGSSDQLIYSRLNVKSGAVWAAYDFNPNGDLYVGGTSGNYLFAKNPTSDRDLKQEIVYDNGLESYEKVKSYNPSKYIFKFDPEKRVRRGLIAQDLYKIDPEYVKLIPAQPIVEEDHINGVVQEDDMLALDSNVMLLDIAIALKHAIDKLEKAEKRIVELEKLQGINKPDQTLP